MKTVGERIRQAREAKRMSGEELALAVGYKHQSAIGNLENRATGQGGHKIREIATTLEVPLEWLMSGPDNQHIPVYRHNVSEEVLSTYQFKHPPSIAGHGAPLTDELIRLFRRLPAGGQHQLLQYAKFLLTQISPSPHVANGDGDSLSKTKAA